MFQFCFTLNTNVHTAWYMYTVHTATCCKYFMCILGATVRKQGSYQYLTPLYYVFSSLRLPVPTPTCGHPSLNTPPVVQSDTAPQGPSGKARTNIGVTGFWRTYRPPISETCMIQGLHEHGFMLHVNEPVQDGRRPRPTPPGVMLSESNGSEAINIHIQ